MIASGTIDPANAAPVAGFDGRDHRTRPLAVRRITTSNRQPHCQLRLGALPPPPLDQAAGGLW